jgi:hypothetical protein
VTLVARATINGAGGPRPAPTLADWRMIRAVTVAVAVAPPAKRVAGEIVSVRRGAAGAAAYAACAVMVMSPTSAASRATRIPIDRK